MSVVIDKVERSEFEAEEKTGNRSSFVVNFEEELSKTTKNRWKSVWFREFEAPSNSGGLFDAPRSPVWLRIRRVFNSTASLRKSTVLERGEYRSNKELFPFVVILEVK